MTGGVTETEQVRIYGRIVGLMASSLDAGTQFLLRPAFPLGNETLFNPFGNLQTFSGPFRYISTLDMPFVDTRYLVSTTAPVVPQTDSTILLLSDVEPMTKYSKQTQSITVGPFSGTVCPPTLINGRVIGVSTGQGVGGNFFPNVTLDGITAEILAPNGVTFTIPVTNPRYVSLLDMPNGSLTYGGTYATSQTNTTVTWFYEPF
jgi:hypothetical protein